MTASRTPGLVAALGVLMALALAHVPRASAQVPLVLTVDPAVPVSPTALRDGLARDLGRVVELADAGPVHLAIAMRDGAAELAYADAEATRSRRVVLPDDRGEATATLTLIASNLVRDPTVQLVGPPIAQASASLAAPVTDAAEAEPAVEPIPPPAEPAPSFAEQHPFELGVGLLGGAASTPSGVQGYGYFGIELMGTIHPNLRIGVTRLSLGLGFSSSESFLFSLQGTPTLELFAFVDRHVEVFAQLGVALQGRAQTAFREGFFQVAPFLGAGVRFWLTDWLTIGVEIGLHVIATDSFVMGSVALPQGSIAGSGGLSVGFHY